MPTNFKEAAQRHWLDADLLLNNKRLANADQLFGLAAECALKAVMQGSGMSLKNGIPQDQRYKVHIGDLWHEFCTFANGKICARYLNYLDQKSNPFANWRISQRYCQDSDITVQIVNDHLGGAQQAMTVMNLAYDDGVVT